MEDKTIRTIFINVMNGFGRHGSFLVAYATAVIYADGANFALLRETSIRIIEKYNLNRAEYLVE